MVYQKSGKGREDAIEDSSHLSDPGSSESSVNLEIWFQYVNCLCLLKSRRGGNPVVLDSTLTLKLELLQAWWRFIVLKIAVWFFNFCSFFRLRVFHDCDDFEDASDTESTRDEPGEQGGVEKQLVRLGECIACNRYLYVVTSSMWSIGPVLWFCEICGLSQFIVVCLSVPQSLVGKDYGQICPVSVHKKSQNSCVFVSIFTNPQLDISTRDWIFVTDHLLCWYSMNTSSAITSLWTRLVGKSSRRLKWWCFLSIWVKIQKHVGEDRWSLLIMWEIRCDGESVSGSMLCHLCGWWMRSHWRAYSPNIRKHTLADTFSILGSLVWFERGKKAWMTLALI